MENWQKSLAEGQFQQVLEQVTARKLSPGEAARILIGVEVVLMIYGDRIRLVAIEKEDLPLFVNG